MSDIITMMYISEEIKTVMDFPDDFELVPLGSYEDVMRILKELFPDADYSDPTWIRVRYPHEIEVIMRIEDTVMSIGLRKPSSEIIRDLNEKTGWRGIQGSSSEIVP